MFQVIPKWKNLDQAHQWKHLKVYKCWLECKGIIRNLLQGINICEDIWKWERTCFCSFCDGSDSWVWQEKKKLIAMGMDCLRSIARRNRSRTGNECRLDARVTSTNVTYRKWITWSLGKLGLTTFLFLI